MRVITKKRLTDFYTKHAAARAPLAFWYRVISDSYFEDFNDLRNAFRRVDYVKNLYVFDVGSSRLIAAIHFNRQIVYVRHVLTHEEYDQGKWKDK